MALLETCDSSTAVRIEKTRWKSKILVKKWPSVRSKWAEKWNLTGSNVQQLYYKHNEINE